MRLPRIPACVRVMWSFSTNSGSNAPSAPEYKSTKKCPSENRTSASMPPRKAFCAGVVALTRRLSATLESALMKGKLRLYRAWRRHSCRIVGVRSPLLRVMALPLFALPIAAKGPADSGEVRIRYGIYVPPPPVITAQSNLVELAVTVRDRGERSIGGFTVSDFEVLDNGKPRQITFFSRSAARLVWLPRLPQIRR